MKNKITFILFALVTAGFISVFDTLFSLLIERPVIYANLIELVTAMGVFFVFIVLIWILLWSLFALFARKMFTLSAEDSAAIFSVFTMTWFFALLLSRDIEVNTTFSLVIFYGLITAMACLVCMLYYRVSVKNQDSLKKIVPLFLLFILAVTGLLVIWLIKYHISAQAIKLFILLAGLALSYILVKRFMSVKQRQWLSITTIVLTIVILAFSAAGILTADSFTVLPDTAKAGPQKIKHIILLTIDTLRADFVSCYNSDFTRTPNIDSIAEEGIRFENAMATSPWTLPSFASLFTGLSPDVHMTTKINHRLPDSLETIAEVMQEKGYVTATVGLNKVLTDHYGTLQGFQQRCFFPKSSRGESYGANLLRHFFKKTFAEKATTTDLTDYTINWLKKHVDEDFFLWLHYYDPHLPYSPPKAFQPTLKLEQNIGDVLDEEERISIRSGTLVPDAVEREWIRQLYIGEIHYVDDNIGRLLATLDELGIYDDCLLVVLSDHGEEFWEHQGFAHGHTLYQELLHIPLIIKLPGALHAKNRVEQRVSLERVKPTLLDLCGIDYHPELHKSSLAPLWEEKTAKQEDEIIFATGMLFYEEQKSVLFDDFKYIQYMISDKELAYDLRADPFEERSVVEMRGEQTELAKKILQGHNQLARGLRRQLGLGDESNIRTLDKETLEILKSIGYLQ
ncbi:sulfatase-like hydrolase/transferase [candidate division KSB1 bacterium]|nr:sulfatase-like hydrolase/transferase [candidate division KSB1 bacterium]